MDDREKVINKVTAIVADMQEEVDEWKDYSDSELRNGLTCDCDWWYKTLQTLKDALALLKEQEPRVISWQDAESMRLCWVETRFPHTISPADIIHYFAESPHITVFKIHQTPMDWPIDEYGIKWRCWNNEPTNEQMEATPWG